MVRRGEIEDLDDFPSTGKTSAERLGGAHDLSAVLGEPR